MKLVNVWFTDDCLIRTDDLKDIDILDVRRGDSLCEGSSLSNDSSEVTSSGWSEVLDVKWRKVGKNEKVHKLTLQDGRWIKVIGKVDKNDPLIKSVEEIKVFTDKGWDVEGDGVVYQIITRENKGYLVNGIEVQVKE